MPITKALELGQPLDAPQCDDNFNLWHGSPRTGTIAGGILTINGTDWYIVETEAASSFDELTRINGTAIGDVVHLYLADAAHKIVVRHGTNLRLNNGSEGDFLMDTIYDNIVFRSFGGDVLVEISRASIP